MAIDTVGELRELLEGLDDSVEIRMALQPSYPMAGSLRNACLQHGDDGEPQTLWLACSDNEDYVCPREAWSDSEIYGDPEDGDDDADGGDPDDGE